MSWGRRVYPVFFAVFPIIGVTAKNAGSDRVLDTIVLALVVGAITASAYLALYFLLRASVRRTNVSSERVADVSAFILFCAVAYFYLYNYLSAPIQAPIAFLTGNPRMGFATLIGAALVAAMLVVIYRRWQRNLPDISAVGRFLSVLATIVVCWSGAQILYTHIADAGVIKRSTLVRELAQRVKIRSSTTPAGQPTPDTKRDVYIVILDEYPSSAVLRERFGIDNVPFEDTLRAIGFRVPQSVRSNYANTLMSVSSFLNFAQVRALASNVDVNTHDFTVAAYLLEHNRTERFLKRQGYRFVFFPSSWYTSTQHNSDADEEFDLGHHWDLGRALQTSEVFNGFARSSMFSKLLRFFPTEMEVHTDDIARTFAGLTNMPPSRQPTFVFAHILLPHISFIEDAACRPLPRNTALQWGATPLGRRELEAELGCLNREVVRMVRAIIARAKTPPVIILQGDHGSQALNIFASTSGLPSVEQARERFRPFGAYYLPGGGAAALPDSISIVNVLRYTFSYYFNADLPPLPNTMYYSHWMYPYRLTQVDSNFRVVRR
ncbi:MAG: hypothetical protein ABI035_13620 [Gemmatimonadaceae bacterium]